MRSVWNAVCQIGPDGRMVVCGLSGGRSAGRMDAYRALGGQVGQTHGRRKATWRIGARRTNGRAAGISPSENNSKPNRRLLTVNSKPQTPNRKLKIVKTTNAQQQTLNSIGTTKSSVSPSSSADPSQILINAIFDRTEVSILVQVLSLIQDLSCFKSSVESPIPTSISHPSSPRNVQYCHYQGACAQLEGNRRHDSPQFPDGHHRALRKRQVIPRL